MQILRLHWRSLMPWDHSPDNHLTSDQRRDYLMASLAWMRDLIMLVFAVLLLVITGMRLTDSGFALMPLSGDLTLLPMSLILIATVSMTWALRMWTTISRRRALLAIVISLSATWITALACLQGISRREGVFLRTSKTGSSHHRLRTALRLCRWEASFAVALFTSAGLLAASAHPPLLLIFFISVQGVVYVCSPIASLWNWRAQLVSPLEFRRRFEERRLLQMRRHRPSFTMAGGIAAALFAVAVGTTTAVLIAPRTLAPVGGVRHPGVVTTVRAPTGEAPPPAEVTVKPGARDDQSLPVTTRAG